MALRGVPLVRRLRTNGAEFVGVAREARASARAYGGSTLRAAQRTRRARRRGFEWEEMRALGLLDPALDARSAAELVGSGEMRRARERMNPPQITRLARDRAVFARLMHAAGIPGPTLYGLVGVTTGWSRSGRVVSGPDDFATFLAEDVPEHFVVKPCVRGAGPWILRRREGLLTGPDGRITSPRSVLAAATSDGDLAIVQERLRNHPSLDELGAPETLRTLRIVTLVRRDCSVDVIAAVLRLPDERAGDEPGAVHHGVLADVDPASGLLGSAYSARSGRAATPESPAPGLRMPDWGEALELVRTAGPMMLPARTIAWDVALTPGGPSLLGADADYRPWPAPSARSVLGALESAS